MKAVLSYIALFLLPASLVAQEDWRDSLEVAREAYDKGDYAKAMKYYESAQRKAPYDIDFSDEIGQTAYRSRDFERAEKIFEQSAGSKYDSKGRGDGYHNLGNSRMKQKNYKGAIEAYKEALRANPNDDKTRYNLSKAMRKQKEKQRQQGGGQGGQGDQGDEGDDNNQGNQNNQGNDNSGNKPKGQNQTDGSGGNKERDPKDNKGQLPNQMVERELDKLARQEAETKRKMAGGNRSGAKARSGKDW